MNITNDENVQLNWVPCDRRLPDDDMTVLMALNDGEVWPGYIDAGDWYYASGDKVHESTVLYWMDLPAPPTGLLHKELVDLHE